MKKIKSILTSAFALAFVALLFSTALAGEIESSEGIVDEIVGSEEASDGDMLEKSDYLSADRLVTKAHKFDPKETFDFYFGKDGWDEGSLIKMTAINERYMYVGDDRQVTTIIDGDFVYTIVVKYAQNMPDEEVLREEWEGLFSALDIPVMDDYIRQTDYLNGDRHLYTYYLEYDGIKVYPTNYEIGSVGDETDYHGAFVTIQMEDDGYLLIFSAVSDIIEREALDEPRAEMSDDEIKVIVFDAFEDGMGIPVEEANPVEGTLTVEYMYIPVDFGNEEDEYVYDIGAYVRQSVDQDGADELWYIDGLADASFPYCYKFGMGVDYSEDYKTEYFKISDGHSEEGDTESSTEQ